MKQKLLCILLSLLSWKALATHDEYTGCANLANGEAVATKIALMRAKAHWVEYHYGGIVSGRETLLVDNKTTQLAQTIKSESVGFAPSLPSLHIKISKRVKAFDGKPYLCIYLQAMQ